MNTASNSNHKPTPRVNLRASAWFLTYIWLLGLLSGLAGLVAVHYLLPPSIPTVKVMENTPQPTVVRVEVAKPFIVYRDKVVVKEIPVYRERVIYKNKIVYQDKVVYVDKVVVKDKIVTKTEYVDRWYPCCGHCRRCW